LPAHVAYRNHPTRGELIRINCHPLCHSRTFTVKEFDNDFEKTRNAVIKFISELELSGKPYSLNKESEFADMPGIYKIPHGYWVNMIVNNKRYIKTFSYRGTTDEEKKQAAIACYNNIIAKIPK